MEIFRISTNDEINVIEPNQNLAQCTKVKTGFWLLRKVKSLDAELRSGAEGETMFMPFRNR